MLVRVALDWTPNTVHTPLLVAAARGFFAEASIQVEFINPSDDGYATTPARKVLNGTADLAICPSESVIAFAETSVERTTDLRLQAVYALLDKDASSILCSSHSGIVSPKDLDGKVYGSYNARYEDDIVRAMIRNDGGKGDLVINRETAKLDIFAALTNHSKRQDPDYATKIDATWIFSPWEGIKAAAKDNFDGMEFKMHDYAIPYGYSPVLARSNKHALSDDGLRKFLQATSKGFQYARDHHDQAVEILKSYCPDESIAFLDKSLKDIQQYWTTEAFGFMAKDRWDDFVGFLQRESLLKAKIDSQELFVNL